MPRDGKKSKRPHKSARPKKRNVNRLSGNGTALVTLNQMSNKPMRFVKTISNQIIIAGTSNAVSGGGDFTIAALPQFGELAVLFNRYKMNSITFTIRLLDQAPGVSMAQSQMPTMTYRYNYDSNLAVANIQDKLQNQNNVKQFTFTIDNTKFQYKIVPKTITPVYYNITSSGYKLNNPTYIDCAYSSVPHYGLIYHIDELLTGFTVAIDVTYDFSMKYVQ